MRRWCSAGSIPSISWAAISTIDAVAVGEGDREAHRQAARLIVEQAALGILKIVNNNMALAINANSVAKGVDPRNFTLMGFGGAGPLHSVSLAEAIYAKDVICRCIPASPRPPGCSSPTCNMNTRIRRCWCSTSAGEAEFARANAVLDELIGARQPAARRRRHRAEQQPLPPDRRMPLCRARGSSCAPRCRTASSTTQAARR